MNLQVDVQSASGEPVPDEDDIRSWIAAALATAGRVSDSEISVRLVDDAEMAKLNRDYRHREGTTNVLSFPSNLPPELELPLLGDIVICAPLVSKEAAKQRKPVVAHWAHLTIHGTLHLLGYDHLEEADATIMENLESHALQRFGFPCPYDGQACPGQEAQLEREGA